MRGGRLWWASAALLLIASHALAIEDAPPGLALGAVRFTCDAWFDEAAMRRALPLRVGQPVTAEQLAATRQVLEQAQIFRHIAVDVQPEDGAAVVSIVLKRRWVITGLRITGYDAVSWREVQRALRLRLGAFYDGQQLAAARHRLVERYRRLGFPHARVRTHVSKRRGEVDVEIEIREGPPRRVTAVVASGQTGLPVDELQAALRHLVGERQRREVLRDGGRALVAALRAGGYLEAQADGEWVDLDPERTVAWYTVDAGQRAEIEVVGNTHFSREELLGLSDLTTRLVITDGTWRQLAGRMRRAYREAGYYRIKIALQRQETEPERIRFVIDEGRRYAITRVRFVGNRGLSDDELAAQMNTQPARRLPWPRRGAFVRTVFTEDVQRLTAFYHAQGFAEARVVDAPLEIDDDAGTIEVRIDVAEGPRTMVAAVERPDLTGLSRQALRYQTVAGQPLFPAELEMDRQTIATALRRDGYSEAAVEPIVERQRVGGVDEAVVRWRIARGPRRTIGEIIVQGNVETRDEVVRNALPFATGAPLDRQRLQDGQDAVYRLGTYRSVTVQPLSERGEVTDVGVAVAPRPPGRLTWGVGYNTRDGMTANGEVSYDNVARRARRAWLRGRVSVLPEDLDSSQFLTVLGYREPQLLHSAWQWTAELIGERSTRAIDQYKILRGALGNGFTRLPLPRLQVGTEVQLAYADVFDVEPLAFRAQDEGTFFTSSLSPFVLYDGRDDPFEPTRGVFDTLRLRYAPPGVSSVQFGTANLQHSQAYPLAQWLTVVLNARLGYGRALSGEEVLPIRERYFIGGATTVRGYAENSLGPTDIRGVVLGGDTAMTISLEARLPIWDALSGALFIDVGGLFLTQCGSNCERDNGVLNNGFNWNNFRKGTGPGLRYMTPVGPVSLDYGFKIDRRSGESIGEVHFSISGTF